MIVDITEYPEKELYVRMVNGKAFEGIINDYCNRYKDKKESEEDVERLLLSICNECFIFTETQYQYLVHSLNSSIII